ncbi:penicillin-binding protein [Kitasatospora sp. NBC_01287]|uniref:transglycosylase domain-containing protein n=1 Tax=Kitasatospora sp. NBC_01287 TaxID=2903573 RepID=UPI00225B8B6B|nr:transglycosylase domain-containing protein [Kitasatospora sp. NBC_01287]MCX4751054.1 penicillin-binding protein [Kitasatospora sp. NBC_01287]
MVSRPPSRAPRPLVLLSSGIRLIAASGVAGVLLAGIALPFVGGVGLGAKASVDSFNSLPSDFTTPPLSQSSTIYDANNSVIATVYDRDRTVVPSDQIAPLMKSALVDIEDNRFYQHGAIDPKGLLRALDSNASGGGTQGASTLTQQYVKNVFVDEAGDNAAAVQQAQRQTLARKIQEMKYAIKVEQTLTKDQILTNYLNITFFGEGAYGVQAAAQRYFSTDAKSLTLPQAALLAGIEQSPTDYDPIAHPTNAKTRRDTVLKKMAQYGTITKAAADQAIATPIQLRVTAPQQGCITAKAGEGFFCDYVKKIMLSDPAFGASDAARQALWDRGGLQIRTTIDPKAQNAVNTSMADNTRASDQPVAVMSVVQPGTGKILAMGQSRPYGLGSDQTTINLNVSKAMGGGQGFPTGSTFKAIVAAAAMENGLGDDTNLDVPYSEPWPTMTDCQGNVDKAHGQTVHNDSTSEAGTIGMPQALAESINTYFAELEGRTGLCTVDQMANKLGITQQSGGLPLQVVPAMTLGTNSLTPLQMAGVYATFAAHGTFCTPIAISSVTGPDGRNLAVPSANCSQAMSPNTADTLTAMLQGVVQDGGTASGQGLTGRPSAGKTGTTNQALQAWFIGYTPDVVGATVVADTGTQKPLQGQDFGRGPIETAFGAQVAGPVWHEAMQAIVAGTPVNAFPDIQLPTPPPQNNTSDPTDGASPSGGATPNGQAGPSGGATPTDGAAAGH